MEGEIKRLIQKNHVGMCADHISARSLAKCAKEMSTCSRDELLSFRENALELSKREFDCDRLIDGLIEDMKRLCR